ncbi:hypothetical protein [Rhodobacter ferrooxidans]|uniref:Uncharacterized protein n=1 Tax=Rhodobacter ferrooxidans TaxID=371731 RepID=C8S4M3_9RHOB|nr:hypothetical protein [Rhodobacter sp. SW2]EEW24022.1 hypothetical protein Rsw2DRAFT_3001 [Rhodobacter sp. SW2]
MMTDRAKRPTETVIVAVPDELRGHAREAIARLSYLYPNFEFALSETGIEVHGPAVDADLRRDIHYTLVRMKIYSEGAELRAMLWRSVHS